MVKRNLAILFGGYVTSWCVVAIGYSATASVGYNLAPQKAFVLMPLIMQVFGACIITIPAGKLMAHAGRRMAFIIGSGLGILGGLMSAYSLYIGSFWLLTCSTILIGMFNGFGDFIKYAAADLFEDEYQKNRAISIIVSGGVAAAFLGPAMANSSNSYFDWIGVYIGPYILVSVMSVLSLVLFMFYAGSDSAHRAVGDEHATSYGTAAPSLSSIVTQPGFLIGTSMGVLSYFIMSIMMDAFPITMMSHGMHFSHTTNVLQWHMLAMFAPSYFTSKYLGKFGFTTTAVTGICINVSGIIFALEGTDFHNFMVSLILNGLGWNFMYLAGTSMIANIHLEMRKHAEGYNNFAISLTYALSAPLSALLVVRFGWQTLGHVALTLTVLAVLCLVIYRQRKIPMESRQ